MKPTSEGLDILPLPLGEKFDVMLDEKTLGRTVKKITCGEQEIPFTRDGQNVTFPVTVGAQPEHWLIQFGEGLK